MMKKYQFQSSLTPKQLRFCKAYVMAGLDRYTLIETGQYTSKDISNYLCIKEVKLYLNRKFQRLNEALEIKMGLTMEEKLEGLVKVAKLCVPDEAVVHKECDVSGYVKCVAEMNKMQGHYSAIKIESNTHMDEGNEIALKYIKESKKESDDTE